MTAAPGRGAPGGGASVVVDASVVVSALLDAGASRRVLAVDRLHAPHLVDSEVAHVVRRAAARGRLTAAEGWAALDTWRRLAVTRHPTAGLLPRVWQLRDALSAYDAAYVAVAEALGAALVTRDGRISRTPGLRCPVTVLPD